jgi:ribosomal 50S subunit-recycling heat shock protein
MCVASVPEAVKRTRAALGTSRHALRRLLAHGVANGGRIVTEEQRAVAHPVVDVAAAVDVPLERALGTVDVERKRLHATVVVRDGVGEQPSRALEELTRGGQRVGVCLGELGRGREPGHEPLSFPGAP